MSEDEWWEMVFNEKDVRAVLSGCERQCFTFTCRCRKEAISIITKHTGVNYAERS